MPLLIQSLFIHVFTYVCSGVAIRPARLPVTTQADGRWRDEPECNNLNLAHEQLPRCSRRVLHDKSRTQGTTSEWPEAVGLRDPPLEKDS